MKCEKLLWKDILIADENSKFDIKGDIV